MSTVQAEEENLITNESDQPESESQIMNTAEIEITAGDLTSSEPSNNCSKTLAEKRRIALETTIRENKELWARVDELEERLKLKNKKLELTTKLVSVFKDILDEN